jgi:hypothetical protein
MTYDGRKFRKESPTGCWTTYPVQPMTLAEAEFVLADHQSRGTCSEFAIIDVEFEAAQIAFASDAKIAFLNACGWDDMTHEQKRNATDIRKEAIEVFAAAKAVFVASFL